MNLFSASLLQLVRLYLTNSPITEGKRRLYHSVKDFYIAQEPLREFATKHGFKLKGNLNNPDHLYYYFFGEEDERYEIRAVKRILRDGDIVWDIGTNIGFYTCLFAKLVGTSGKVVAFEPALATYVKLTENIHLNHFTNVALNNIGVSTQSGVMRLFSEERGMFEGRASLSIPSKSGVFEEVRVDSIDNLIHQFPKPDFLKIDVEEHQLDLLRGGVDFFSANSPVIFAELKHRDAAVMKATDELLSSMGYSLFKMRKNSFSEVDSIGSSGSRNLLAVKKVSPSFERIKAFLS